METEQIIKEYEQIIANPTTSENDKKRYTEALEAFKLLAKPELKIVEEKLDEKL